MKSFEDRVDRSGGPDACHTWTGGRTGSGYGAVVHEGRQHAAHRVAWLLEHGPIPDGLFVCHRCDNPPCCNVRHLFLGSSGDNIADKVRKQRQARGERNGRAKLTEAQVLYIRENAGRRNNRAIARALGVSDTLVRFILKRENWAHVSG